MQSVFSLLDNKKFFKLVCGAGNEDAESVKRLVYIYAKAGCRVFDLSARKEILDAAKAGVGVNKGVNGGVNPASADDVHYCVSVGIKGDPHISKAEVKLSKCIQCGNCSRNCPNDAIYPPNFIDEKKCIGCGICAKKCPSDAISMYEKDANTEAVLPELVAKGVDILELHIMGHDEKDLEKKWQVINSCNPKIASICIDRENFGNKEVLARIKEMISVRPEYTTIIQADGIPMSGCDDSYKTTLQAVAMAEIIQNAKLPVYIVVSGGTNSKTAELCKQCGIYPNGIAIGSWARKIVKEYISLPDFWDNNEAQAKAVKIAQGLIEANILT